MIAIYGATGLTGKMIATSLVSGGQTVKLGARSSEKLEELVADLEPAGQWSTMAFDLDDEEQVRRFLKGAEVVINCAGPFRELVDSLVEEAVKAGCHYLDISGEQSHFRRLRNAWSEEAKKRGVVVMPGCGFQFALGDLAADLALAQAASRIVVAYAVEEFKMSEGTTKSVVRTFARGGESFVRGEVKRRKTGGKRFDVPFPDGSHQVGIWVPGGEALTVPPRGGVSRVETCLAASDWMAHWAATMMGWMPWAADGLGAVADRLASWVADDPQRQGKEANFLVIAFDPTTSRAHITLKGRDIYGTTAQIAAQMAVVLSERGSKKAGFVGAADVVEPGAFLTRIGVRQVGSED